MYNNLQTLKALERLIVRIDTNDLNSPDGIADVEKAKQLLDTSTADPGPMQTDTSIHYYPKIKGDNAFFSPLGFRDKSPQDYNVVEHIAHMRESIYQGKKIYADKQFQIVSQTIVTTIIDFN